MTPKDKAKELVGKFKKHSMTYYHDQSGWDLDSNQNSAEQCALICVDEMLLELEDIEDGYRMDRVEYWYKVKQEIDKL